MRSLRLAATSAALTLLSVLALAGAGGTAYAEDEPEWDASACAQVIVYNVRGSGQAPQPGADGRAPGYGDTWDAFDPIDPETGGSSIDADRVLDIGPDGSPTVGTGTPFLYDLTQKIHERVGGQLRLSWSPIRYPAIPVSQGNLAGKGLWAVHGYPRSVTAGIRELHRTLKRQFEICGTHTRYVLIGYSQGADVVNSYLRGKIVTSSTTFGIATYSEYLGPSQDVRQQIAAVALVADPNHDPRDAESMSDLDPDLAQKGGLYGVRAGVPAKIAAVTDSICLVGDPVCGQGFTLRPELEKGESIHTDGYRNFATFPVTCPVDGMAFEDTSAITCLADRVVERLGVQNLVLDPPDDAASQPGTSGRDVAFFIDTTGSMDDDIDAAIEFTREQADRIVALDGRVALVQYRDHDDTVPVEIVTPFTQDIGEFRGGLETLYAEGGGDEPEGLLHALMTGFDELEWEYGASKAAVVLTDAGFHEPDLLGGETLPQVERRSLEIDPVNVFPVIETSAGLYADLAARTSGEVIRNTGGDTTLALERALDNIAERPVALLSNGSYAAAAGRSIHFDASGSSAYAGDITEYRWDLDGDGYTDTTTDTPTLDHTFPPGWTGVMQVLVVDSSGRSANASAAVLVEEEPVVAPQPHVPSATDLTVRAESDGEGVALAAQWTTGGTQPYRWVVMVDDDPVTVVDGDVERARVAVDYREEEWTVSLVPMDEDGAYGAAQAATLVALAKPVGWWERPVVWVAALLTFVLGTVGCWLLLTRRARRRAAARGEA